MYFQQHRQASFEGDVVNSDFLFEYHFLDYRDPRSDIKWTPYVWQELVFINLKEPTKILHDIILA